jgi:hypothetical protein
MNDDTEGIVAVEWREKRRKALRCSGPGLLLETERFVEQDVLGCIGFPENGDDLPTGWNRSLDNRYEKEHASSAGTI